MSILKWDNIGTGLKVYVFEKREVDGSLVSYLSNISQRA